MSGFGYAEPRTVSEALSLLRVYGASAAVLAGGTDVINQIHLGKRTPTMVINIKKIADLHGEIIVRPDGVEIGALATLTKVAEHPVIQERFAALAEAAVKVGSKQVRNRGTLAGNICNASPAADTVTGLLVFDAVVNVVTGDEGMRAVPLEEFITGPGRTVLSNDELVANVFLPYLPTQAASTYSKLSRREGVDLATVGVAVAATQEGGARIALGAVGPKAFRASRAENLLKSLVIAEKTINEAIRTILEDAKPISDLRGSREYRLAMVEALTRRAINDVTAKLIGLKED
ncbi:FAD binding domain-containing protein [Anaeroselena agilis]|uniref:Xanthine dehydrogenase family protein subunit M n=1 Tax=Anaeroselena agilis TaxID=3063788 RepID=A0ABU3P485_9FIRM|nr:xanthine dehydrogenase family protein subunit M [Selenomonadales bacterium 4137-cl]